MYSSAEISGCPQHYNSHSSNMGTSSPCAASQSNNVFNRYPQFCPQQNRNQPLSGAFRPYAPFTASAVSLSSSTQHATVANRVERVSYAALGEQEKQLEAIKVWSEIVQVLGARLKTHEIVNALQDLSERIDGLAMRAALVLRLTLKPIEHLNQAPIFNNVSILDMAIEQRNDRVIREVIELYSKYYPEKRNVGPIRDILMPQHRNAAPLRCIQNTENFAQLFTLYSDFSEEERLSLFYKGDFSKLDPSTIKKMHIETDFFEGKTKIGRVFTATFENMVYGTASGCLSDWIKKKESLLRWGLAEEELSLKKNQATTSIDIEE